MAETLMSLLVNLGVDSRGLTQGLDKAKKEVSTSMADMGRSMQKAGAVMTAAVTAPLVAIGAKAIMMASDLDETRNKVNVVFGDSAAIIHNFAKDASSDLGMTNEAAMAAAATYGNLFVTMGLEKKPAADMSASLVQLAADLASFNNADPSEVLLAMQSGLVGQVEPMRKFGVVLSQAAVETKAMEMGLADANGQLSEAAKLQARYQIILEQTGTAQGDFARTADGMANSMRILKAKFGDTLASFGQILLPIALKLVTALNKVLDWFQSMSPAIKTVIVVFAALAAAAGPLLVIFGTLITSIGAIAGAIGMISAPIIAVVAVIAAAIGGLIAIIAAIKKAWDKDLGGMQTAVMNFASQVQKRLWLFGYKLRQVWKKIETSLAPLRELFDKIGSDIGDAIAAAMPILQQKMEAIFQWIENTVFPILIQLAEWLAQKIPLAIEWLGKAWEWLKGAIGNAINWLLEKWNQFKAFLDVYISPKWNELKKWFEENIPTAIDFLKTKFDEFKLWLEVEVPKSWDNLLEYIDTKFPEALLKTGGLIDNMAEAMDRFGKGGDLSALGLSAVNLEIALLNVFLVQIQTIFGPVIKLFENAFIKTGLWASAVDHANLAIDVLFGWLSKDPPDNHLTFAEKLSQVINGIVDAIYAAIDAWGKFIGIDFNLAPRISEPINSLPKAPSVNVPVPSVPTPPPRPSPGGPTPNGATINIFNPAPEPAGMSVEKSMRNLNYLGIVA